jgi:stage III sporulation protein AG
MDWQELKCRAEEFLKKYRYVMLILLAGLVLMLLPSGEQKHEAAVPFSESTPEQERDLQASLGQILSMIEGAGKVQVLLTEATGQRTHYQTDEDISTGESSSDIRKETVVITNGSRAESGLVRQVDPPVYQGAIVICQGADSAAVRLAIVEAVANATGLSSNRISVLKMKA